MPTRRILSRIHAIAGVLALVTILTFLSSLSRQRHVKHNLLCLKNFLTCSRQIGHNRLDGDRVAIAVLSAELTVRPDPPPTFLS